MQKDFEALLALSIHRGPDQTSVWQEDQVQLGFNRLAILDLTEAGHQPMKSPSGRYMVVFNGEIYNHMALRQKLPETQYWGHSDTETITHALEEWGIRQSIEKLDGMFALAIYDRLKKELTLARDFAGIKPLFYGVKNKAIVFASQYDQVHQHPLFKKASINHSVLKLYLQQHYLPAPFGLHEGIRQVHPGEIVTMDQKGEIRTTRYWELPSDVDDFETDEKKAQQLLSEALQTATGQQMIADVPLGAFLSGGVDSPLVCAVAKEFTDKLDVFTIGSDSAKHDESVRAAEFAESLKLNHHLWKLNDDEIFSYWEEAVSSLHEPLADFSIIPTYLVSKLAKKQVTAALSGDGGDELFFGYERFWSIAQNLKYQSASAFRRKAVYAGKKYLNAFDINRMLVLDSQAAAHQSLHNRFYDYQLESIIPALKDVSLPGKWDTYTYETTSDLRTLMLRMRKAEFYGMMQKTLRKVDLASMQNSLEVRVPFLSKGVIEVALKIDPLLSMGNHGRKETLKTMLRLKIPQVKDDGIKRGFTIPLRFWISSSLHAKFAAMAEELPTKLDLFRKSEIQSMLKRHKNGEKDLKWPLFTMYALNSYEA